MAARAARHPVRAVQNNKMRGRLSFRKHLALLVAFCLYGAPVFSQQQQIDFDIEVEDLATALIRFSEQADLVFVAPRTLISEKTAPTVKGPMSPEVALELLLSESGLAGEITSGGVVVVRGGDNGIASMPAGAQPDERSTQPAASPDGGTVSAAAADAGVQYSGITQSIEEIVVTARKRTESMQHVPISMQAFNADDIDKLQMLRADDVGRHLPNVVSASTHGDTSITYTIRGIGSQDFQTTSLNSIGIYLDDVSLQSPISSAFALFDMERIEVLRGPQNTLFGRNTTGGAINFITRKPDPNRQNAHGFIEASIGRYAQADVSGAVGFAMGRYTAGRMSVSVNTRAKWQSNLHLGRDVFDTERYAGRFQILSEPSDSLEILAKGHFGLNRGQDRNHKSLGLRDPVNPAPPFLGGMPCMIPSIVVEPGDPCSDFSGFVDSGEPEEVNSTFELLNDIDTYGASLTIIKAFDAVTLKSITSYESNELQRSNDDDVTAADVFAIYSIVDQAQWSQEFQLTESLDRQLRWTAGLLYFHEDAEHVDNNRIGFLSLGAGGELQQTNDVFSVYGQIDYDISDRVTLTSGLRVTSDEKDGSVLSRFFDISGISTDEYISQSLAEANTLMIAADTLISDSTNEWGGKLGLQFQIDDDSMIYASVARGFKTSAFTVSAIQVALSPQFANVPAETEVLLTYELGFKSMWGDDRMRINGAAFWNDWDDMQVFDVEQTPAGPVTLLTNVPAAEAYGAEIEALWIPAAGWTVQAGLGLLKGKVNDSGNVPGVGVGFVLPRSPDLSFNGLVRKEWASGSGIAALQADVRHVTEQFYQADHGEGTRQAAYTTMNARASYIFGRENRYEIAVWGRNITDESYCTYRFPLDQFNGNAVCYISDPVSYGARIKVDF